MRWLDGGDLGLKLNPGKIAGPAANHSEECQRRFSSENPLDDNVAPGRYPSGWATRRRRRHCCLTPLVVTRALLLNGIAGLALGWLYWKRGLELAMIAHLTTDFVLLVIAPMLASA
jgi:hypothetical protein